MEGVILGATGLIGNELLQLLLKDDRFSKVRILVRKPTNLQHSKLEERIIDFNDNKALEANLGTGDVLFCCIGTTMKKMKGDKEAYFKVDHDIPVHAAACAYEKGFKYYCLVSSMGANPTSNNFYLNLKGSTERGISKYPFEGIHVFRPSMLLGDRAESRPLETAGQQIMKALSFLVPRNYKAIPAKTVARAMINSVINEHKGWRVYENQEIFQIGG